MNSSLTRKLNKLVLWHNARSQLLDCIISQKMGLFHHVSLSGPTQQQVIKQYLEVNVCLYVYNNIFSYAIITLFVAEIANSKN